jgi:hypothetical protein
MFPARQRYSQNVTVNLVGRIRSKLRRVQSDYLNGSIHKSRHMERLHRISSKISEISELGSECSELEC